MLAAAHSLFTNALDLMARQSDDLFLSWHGAVVARMLRLYCVSVRTRLAAVAFLRNLIRTAQLILP
jgi:hypothetical protein